MAWTRVGKIRERARNYYRQKKEDGPTHSALEASFPPFRRAGSTLLGPGTADARDLPENAGPAIAPAGKSRKVVRIVHPLVPPKVENRLTDWGQSLRPALDALLACSESKPVI